MATGNILPRSALSQVFCPDPFVSFHVYQGGNVSNCCYSWLPHYIGNINQISLLEMLKTELSRKIQKSVLDGSYTYCNSELCPSLSLFLKFGEVEPHIRKRSPDQDGWIDRQIESEVPISVFFDYDRSCNLYCESCRTDRILFTEASAPMELLKTHAATIRSVDELLETGRLVLISLTGSGDPFGSPLYAKYLRELTYRPNLQINLSTNGTLMTPDRLTPDLRAMLRFMAISVDGVTPGTYAKLRRGGRFENLNKNLKELDNLLSAGAFKLKTAVQLNFIVQADNFHEIPEFVRWGSQFKNDFILWFNLINDWGHLPKAAFESKAIWRPSHPKHAEFIEVLKDPILRSRNVRLGNMSRYLPAENASAEAAL